LLNDDTVKSINYTQFKELVALNDKVTIIDVREVDEYMVECIPNTLLFPVQFIKSNYEVLNKSRIYVIICEKGGRSLDVVCVNLKVYHHFS
jgi:rhodanese-related sulfurtransferase